jgi:hypothetical protein
MSRADLLKLRCLSAGIAGVAATLIETALIRWVDRRDDFSFDNYALSLCGQIGNRYRRKQSLSIWRTFLKSS